MAVDVGALIAESIDRFYAQHEWVERHNARVRELIERLCSGNLTEAEDFDPTMFGQPDPGRAHNPKHPSYEAYRRGYQAGWKALRDNQDKPNPKDPSDLQNKDYMEGWTHGHQGSGHAHEFEKAHAANDFENAASHAMMLNMLHYPRGREGQGPSQAEQDTIDYLEKARPDLHTVGAHEAAKVLGRIHQGEVHPADYGREMKNIIKGHIKRAQGRAQAQAGVEGGQGLDPDQPFDPADVRGAPPEAGVLEPAAPNEEQVRKDRQESHALHLRDLARAAFGQNAAMRHEALARAGLSPEERQAHEHYHPDIDAFMSEHFNEGAGDLGPNELAHLNLKATRAAHDAWKSNLIDWARQQQAMGHGDFEKRLWPITQEVPGDPYGRHSLVANDGTLLGPGIDYKKTKHRDEVKHAEVDPVRLLEHALNDDFGFGSTGDSASGRPGWRQKIAWQTPGFENYTPSRITVGSYAQTHGFDKKAREENPQREGEGNREYNARVNAIAKKAAAEHDAAKRPEEQVINKQIRPHGGGLDGLARRIRLALHKSQSPAGDRLAYDGESGEESPMWRHHFMLADLARSQAKAGTGQEPAVQDVLGKWASKKRKKFGRYEWETYIRAYHLVEAVDFMLNMFQDWVRENTTIHEGHLPAIKEELFSKVAASATYGRLFEVH